MNYTVGVYIRFIRKQHR